jgi:SH3 domain-containing YSC84-like protein 1
MRKAPAIVLVAVVLALTAPSAATAGHGVVEDARATLWEMLSDGDFASLHGLLARARGVVIVPQLYKAGFIIGGEAGRGVLLAHDLSAGTWSYPAFLDFGSASIGLQLGASQTQLVLVVMTEAGLEALLSDRINVGADASVAAGPVGAAARAATTSSDFDADIYAYGTSEGLFAGVSVQGGLIVPDEDANIDFYGEAATTREIVQAGTVSNAAADPLRAMLMDLQR